MRADVAARLEQQRERVLRDARRAVAGHVAHGDAALFGRRDVHNIIARRKHADELQVRRSMDDRRGERRLVRIDRVGAADAG